MKVAVSAKGPDQRAQVDPRFGRARWFVIVDTESGESVAVENAQNLNAVQGAGIQAAQNVAGHGAGAVLTGHCGPKAFKTLNAAGIKVFTDCSGTVAEVVDKWKNGELKPVDRPDVEGHWV